MSKEPAVREVQIFLCYRRADGASIAEWLFRLLDGHEYHDPEGKPCRIGAYFDQAAPGVADWRSHHLPSLQSARALIVICTPGIARDFSGGGIDWVYEELRWWIANRTAAPLVVDATQDHGKWIPQPILAKWPNLNRIETDPQRALIAEGQLDGSYATALRTRIVESLRESEKATVYQDVVRYKKKNRQLAILSALLLTATIGALVSVGFARYSLRLAQERKRIADESTQFMTGLFDSADPDHTFGGTRTAAELLAKGKAKISEPSNEHRLRGTLMRAMGAAYTGLGDSDTAVQLLNDALSELNRVATTPDEKFRVHHSLGEAQLYSDAEFDKARANLETAIALSGDEGVLPSERATAHVSLGDFHAWNAPPDVAKAREQYQQALELDRTAKDMAAAARDLNRLGSLELAAKQPDVAESHYQQAIATAKQAAPEDRHFLLAQYEHDLASLRYTNGALTEARQGFETAVHEFTAIYGPDGGETAVAENNLGRVLIEQDQPAAARALLERAVQTQSVKLGGNFTQFAFSLNNAGLALREAGEPAAAAEHFEHAWKVAMEHGNAIGGQSLSHLAEMALAIGDLDRAGRYLDDAEDFFKMLDVAHDWRYAIYQSARGELEVRTCNFGTANKLLKESADKMQKRWPSPNLFTRASDRRADLYETISQAPGKCRPH